MEKLIVDGMLSGTGIRDAVKGGYRSLETLELPEAIRSKIVSWLREYENAFYYNFSDKEECARLDREGIEITKALQALGRWNVSYYSASDMKALQME